MEQFGRKEILNQIFELLWSDISHKIAAQYAQDLYYDLIKIHDIMDSNLKQVTKKMKTGKLIVAAIKDDFSKLEDAFDTQLDWATKKVEQIIENMDQTYQKRICSLMEFCEAYGSSLGHDIEFYSVDDFLPDDFLDFEVDELLERTKFGKFMNEIEDFDDDSASIKEMLKMIFKGVGMIVSLQSLLRDVCDEFMSEFKRNIPGPRIIESLVYGKLMEGFKENS